MAAPWSLGAQLRINGRIHGQQTVNVLHFATNETELDVTTPSPLLTALLAAVVDCIITALLAGITEDWEFVSCDAHFVHNAGGSPIGTDVHIQTAPPDTNGTLGPASVSFAASLVNLRSGIGGKNGRGKMFLPPPGEADTTAGQMSSSVSTALSAFLTCMAGKFGGTTPSTVWRWGVFSRKLGGANYSSFDSGFFPVATASPVVNLAVISRRRIGHGR